MLPSLFIQWKGTDACLDFHCLCGKDGHYDGLFAYGLRCSHCKRVYTLPDTLTLVEGAPGNDIVQNVKMDEEE